MPQIHAPPLPLFFHAYHFPRLFPLQRQVAVPSPEEAPKFNPALFGIPPGAEVPLKVQQQYIVRQKIMQQRGRRPSEMPADALPPGECASKIVSVGADTGYRGLSVALGSLSAVEFARRPLCFVGAALVIGKGGVSRCCSENLR